MGGPKRVPHPTICGITDDSGTILWRSVLLDGKDGNHPPGPKAWEVCHPSSADETRSLFGAAILSKEPVEGFVQRMDGTWVHCRVRPFWHPVLLYKCWVDGNHIPLTPRELQIANLLADSYHLGEIANKLGIAEGTVSAHRRNILAKCRVRDVAGLVRWMIRHGLLVP